MTQELPTDLSRNYRYTIRQSFRHGRWEYSWELIGANGGVQLHISGPHEYDGRENWSAGLEYHWRKPPSYLAQSPPSHDQCWLLNCPCWHDGTSLYAQDHYLPLFIQGDTTRILRSLARDADDKLNDIRDEP